MRVHEVIHTDKGPAALGPYSQATKLPVGDRSLVFVAGQIPLDPSTGKLIGGSAGDQAHRVMQNVQVVADTVRAFREAGAVLDEQKPRGQADGSTTLNIRVSMSGYVP